MADAPHPPSPTATQPEAPAASALPQPTAPTTTQRAALAVSVLSSFLTPFVGAASTVAWPVVGEDLGLSTVRQAWLGTAYLLATGACLLPAGRLGDIYGRKRVFGTGVAVFTLAALLSGLAPSGGALLLSIALQGVGSAMIYSTGMAILTSVISPERRGWALGIAVGATYVGLSCGPLAGGWLTQQLGWRSVFLVSVPLGVVLMAVLLKWLKGEWAEARGQRFDLPGAILSAASLAALAVGAEFTAFDWGTRAALMAAGLAGAAAFVLVQWRSASPLLNLRLFRGNSLFAMSNLAAYLNYSSLSAAAFLLNQYLQKVRSLAPRDAGLLLMVQPVLMAALSPYSGRLSDRLEPRVPASAGMALMMSGLVLLALFLGPATPLALIGVFWGLIGVGMGLFSSPNTNAVMGSVERPQLGVASAMLATTRVTGQLTSMVVATLILSAVVGETHITSAESGHFLLAGRMAYSVFAALSLTGMLASLARGRLHGQGRTAAG
jgi:EmrB/QacA subfamily drug resistance transporter